MPRAGFDVVVGSFDKNGTIYHAAVTVPFKDKKDQAIVYEYKVLLSHPSKKTVAFKIKKDENGRWIPDKRKQIDPWIADNIGHFIETTVLKIKG